MRWESMSDLLFIFACPFLFYSLLGHAINEHLIELVFGYYFGKEIVDEWSCGEEVAGRQKNAFIILRYVDETVGWQRRFYY